MAQNFSLTISPEFIRKRPAMHPADQRSMSSPKDEATWVGFGVSFLIICITLCNYILYIYMYILIHNAHMFIHVGMLYIHIYISLHNIFLNKKDCPVEEQRQQRQQRPSRFEHLNGARCLAAFWIVCAHYTPREEIEEDGWSWSCRAYYRVNVAGLEHIFFF